MSWVTGGSLGVIDSSILAFATFWAQQCTTLGHAGGRGDNGPMMVLTGTLTGGNVGHVPAVFRGVPSLFGPFGCKNICVLLERFSSLKLLFLMMFGIYE